MSYLKTILIGTFAAISLHAGVLENHEFKILISNNNEVEIINKTSGRAFIFEAAFSIFKADKDPELALRPARLDVAYNVPTWKLGPQTNAQSRFEARARENDQHGDGFDERILTANQKDTRTADVFAAGKRIDLLPIRTSFRDGKAYFDFPLDNNFKLKVVLELPQKGYPLLSYQFEALKEGYYSIAYTGAPASDFDLVEEIWQPLIWTEKRFPKQSFLSMAFRCPLPTSFTQVDAHTIGVLADPSEYSFNPLPLFNNSRFGVAVRNMLGEAQPLLFAPVLGGHGSFMHENQGFAFKLQLIVEPSPIIQTYGKVAGSVYGFKDYRNNALGSINAVIDRMVDYGMSSFANFNDALKGCSYSTDVPGAVKNVSSLNPLNLALLRDDESIFEERAYPIVEYLLSREKFLFTLDPEEKVQSPSRRMKGPASPLSELTSLYQITKQSNPFYLHLAKDLYAKDRVLNLDLLKKGDRWQNSLALYQASGSPRYLKRACEDADVYIRSVVNQPRLTFGDNPFFWTDYVPDFAKLLELYEATDEIRYLDAAHKVARRFCLFTWMSPAIPNQPILVNPNDEAPVYWYLKRKRATPMLAKETWMPAWRLSEMGLTPESSGTSSGHRAIFMANYAPWLLRIAGYTQDPFLEGVARSAIVGRYQNFPGYHINTARTNIYENADYPLRHHNAINVNSFHYNHIWPGISMLFDFLVVDTWKRSEGAITFPSVYIEGYAYLQNKFYGHEIGKFYGYEDAILWMPKDLFNASSGQLNGLSARGEGRAYFAFTNQDKQTIESEIQINRKLLGASSGPIKAQVWINNKKVDSRLIEADTFSLTVPPNGIAALVLEGVNPHAPFQEKLLNLSQSDAWVRDYLEGEEGGVRAMLLNWGETKKRAFVYLEADDSEFSSVALHLEDDKILTDKNYPYEFTVPIAEGATRFNFNLTATSVTGQKVNLGGFSLSKQED